MLPGALFGELTLINQKKWRHATIFALEPSVLLMFNNNNINRAIKEASEKAGFQDLLIFLTKIFQISIR
jgi:CRP-like cAMP-binding protein